MALPQNPKLLPFYFAHATRFERLTTNPQWTCERKAKIISLSNIASGAGDFAGNGKPLVKAYSAPYT